MKIALIYAERCLAHDNGSMVIDERARGWLDVPHFESAARVARTYSTLSASGVLDKVEHVTAREASEDDLTLVHSRSHIQKVKDACASSTPVTVGPDARARRGTWEPALLSAGGTLSAVDWVLAEAGRRGYALLRPPGHHASADTAMGFCLFNNVAIAARYAQRSHGIERVAIIDWDVHHGNGTQDVFYVDPSVLVVSLHQDALYPLDTGRVEERGSGAGLGATVNIPLPAGSSDDAYLLAFRQIIAPALASFGPELILVSAGQDPGACDPLGRMMVSSEGFRAMTRLVCELADQLCAGRVVAVQEGGYNVDHMPYCVLAIVEQLAGLPPRLDGEPLEIDVPRSIREWERDAISAVARQLKEPSR